MWSRDLDSVQPENDRDGGRLGGTYYRCTTPEGWTNRQGLSSADRSGYVTSWHSLQDAADSENTRPTGDKDQRKAAVGSRSDRRNTREKYVRTIPEISASDRRVPFF